MTALHAFFLFLFLAPLFSLIGLLIYQYGRIWRGLADSMKDWR